MTQATETLRHFVSCLSKIANLGPEPCNAFLELAGREMVIRANQTVRPTREGGGGVITLVVRGMLAQATITADGTRQIVALNLPGDVCDLYAVALPSKPADLVATTDSLVFRVPHAEVSRLIGEYPELAGALWQYCSARMLMLHEWMVRLGTRDARQRVLHLLCEIAFRSGSLKGSGPVSFDLPVTQSHLGEALSLTAVHVNRVLRLLRADGLLEMARGMVTIFNLPRLIAEAEFSPDYLMLYPSPIREKVADYLGTE